MSRSLGSLANHVVLRRLGELVQGDWALTAELLEYLGEVDARRLFLPAGYSSMLLYCVGELHMSDDSALRRIGVARAARQFPAILPALAEGRLNMTTVLLLTPRLTPETAESLLAAAVHKTKEEIRLLLAERFPRPDVPTAVRPLAEPVAESGSELALERVAPQDSQALTPLFAPRAQLAPLAPGRFAVQLTICQEAHDLLKSAQALLGHSVPSGDIGEIFLRAMREYVGTLEKRKFAATTHPRPHRGTPNGRHVPAEVRRAVSERDKGQCTFVSESGHRCESRERLEFDHIDPVARGGKATVDGMRLLCRAHNQYAAEETFGTGFMQRKREEARARAAEEKSQDLIPYLRTLGFTNRESREGIRCCGANPDAPIEERMKRTLQYLAPNARKIAPPLSSSA